jgi:glutamyl-tRNA synthetase
MFDFLANLALSDQLLFVEINKERIKKFEDLLPLNRFFIDDINADETLLLSGKSKEEIKKHLSWVYSEIENIENWNLENVKEIEIKVKSKAAELDWKVGEVFYPIRIAVAGSKISPPLFESIYLLGKDKTLTLLSKSVK